MTKFWKIQLMKFGMVILLLVVDISTSAVYRSEDPHEKLEGEYRDAPIVPDESFDAVVTTSNWDGQANLDESSSTSDNNQANHETSGTKGSDDVRSASLFCKYKRVPVTALKADILLQPRQIHMLTARPRVPKSYYKLFSTNSQLLICLEKTALHTRRATCINRKVEMIENLRSALKDVEAFARANIPEKKSEKKTKGKSGDDKKQIGRAGGPMRSSMRSSMRRKYEDDCIGEIEKPKGNFDRHSTSENGGDDDYIGEYDDCSEKRFVGDMKRAGKTGGPKKDSRFSTEDEDIGETDGHKGNSERLSTSKNGEDDDEYDDSENNSERRFVGKTGDDIKHIGKTADPKNNSARRSMNKESDDNIGETDDSNERRSTIKYNNDDDYIGDDDESQNKPQQRSWGRNGQDGNFIGKTDDMNESSTSKNGGDDDHIGEDDDLEELDESSTSKNGDDDDPEHKSQQRFEGKDGQKEYIGETDGPNESAKSKNGGDDDHIGEDDDLDELDENSTSNNGDDSQDKSQQRPGKDAQNKYIGETDGPNESSTSKNGGEDDDSQNKSHQRSGGKDDDYVVEDDDPQSTSGRHFLKKDGDGYTNETGDECDDFFNGLAKQFAENPCKISPTARKIRPDSKRKPRVFRLLITTSDDIMADTRSGHLPVKHSVRPQPKIKERQLADRKLKEPKPDILRKSYPDEQPSPVERRTSGFELHGQLRYEAQVEMERELIKRILDKSVAQIKHDSKFNACYNLDDELADALKILGITED